MGELSSNKNEVRVVISGGNSEGHGPDGPPFVPAFVQS